MPCRERHWQHIPRNRTSEMMKTLLTVLTVSLFYLCVAEVSQLDGQAGEANPTESPVINAACSAGNEKNYIQLALMLKELEAKLKDTEKQFEKKLANLRLEIQGKIILHSYFINSMFSILIMSYFHATPQGSRVAFGASISNVGNIGPFNTEITLLYRNVYFNSGSFNPATGKLTIIICICTHGFIC